MTKEEAITIIKDHMFVHKIYEERAVKITEALNMAISALEQPEPCEDAMSRQAIFDTVAEYEKQLCEILGDENELAEVVKILKHRLIALPSAQSEQKIGKFVRWMVITETPDHISYTPHHKCSLCGNELLIDNINYCYICGARLIEDREAERRKEN